MPDPVNTRAGVIGLDLGTSALKGVLATPAGDVLHVAERRVDYATPAPGRVECDAEAHWAEVCALLRELAAAAPGPVRAIAAAAASGNTLLADVDGRPLTPVINWMDSRCSGNLPPALAGLTSEAVHDVTGWPCVDSFPLAHLAWLREHDAARYRQAARVCMNTDWLLFKLTGQWRMDHSTAATFHLQDELGRRWHAPFLERLGLRESQLSTLCPSGQAAGRLTPAAAAATGLSTDTVAVTGCFDHPAAARAMGVLRPGQLMLSCGTSWVGFLPCHDRAVILAARMLCDPFLADEGGPWGAIFSVPMIGPRIDWYVKNLVAPGEVDPFRIFNELAAQAAPGCAGLAIDVTAEPRPVAGERHDIARAVMEGAVRALLTLLRRIEGHGLHFTEAVLVGGPSRSPVWPGIIAEMTGLTLSIGSPHAGAQGAALLAAAGAGLAPHNSETNTKHRGNAGAA